MQESVQNRRGQSAVIVEDAAPLFEGFVGGQHDGAALVALADDLEEEVGAMLVDGQVTSLAVLGYAGGFNHISECGIGVMFDLSFVMPSCLAGIERHYGVPSRPSGAPDWDSLSTNSVFECRNVEM